MKKKIAIIGGGNLGTAIAQGLIDKQYCHPSSLCVTRRKPDNLESIKSAGVTVHSDNLKAAAEADMIILAVKPYQVLDVCKEISEGVNEGDKVISVATGISTGSMAEALNGHGGVYRAMPNTAIAIGESMTCICGNGAANEADLEEISRLFQTVGETAVITEELMNASTVLGACGIAYAMRFIRAASQGGIAIGFHADVAQKIAAQTVKGAADLLIKNGLHPESEIDKVTTPQGCTIAGLNEMEHHGFSSALIKGIITSYQKI